MGIAGAAAAPPAAPASHTSPIASIPSFGLSVTSHMGRQLPPLPASLHVPEQHELSRSGPLYQAPLRDASSSPTHLQPTGAVDASATALHFPRSRAEPPVMERGKKSDRDFRRSNTAPVYPTVASPSATIPTLGVTTTALLTYHTPQPVRAYSDAVENYAWEVSKAANSGITKSMRAHVDKEIGRVGVPKERPPLLRAVSESEVGLRERERERSSPRNRNPSYVPLYESYRCSGRDSVGSMISNDGGASFMHSLVNDRRTSSDFLAGMIDDQDSVSVGHTTFSAAREMVRSRLSGASMLSDAASPQMALDPYSPVANRHSSPGNFGIASGSGFHVPRESLQMHHRMHSAHAHVQDTSSARKNKKLFNSKAKQRRMSMAPQLHATTHAHHHMQSIAETSFSDDFFSPAAKPKCLSGVKSRNRRQSSMLSTKQSSSDLMTTEQSFHSHHSGNDCELSFDSDIGDGEGDGNGNANDMHYFTATTCLNELNFKGAVIGGVYQHCFDKASPVVAAPTGADKRVIDVTIEDDNSLVLSLYLPRQKTTQRIDLGSKWQWIRCSPTGYLAFSSAILPHQPVVCYFLPKHPDDWSKQQQSQQQQLAAAAPSGAARNRRVSIVPQHEYNPRASLSFASPSARQHTNSLDMEVDFMSVDGITGCPAIEEEGDGDDDAGAVQMHYADDLNISCISDPADDKLSAHFAALEIALEKGPMAASSEHRSNPALIALILEFLIEDTALFGAATAGKKPTAVATANNNEPIRRRSQRKDSATEKTVVATPAELAMLQLQACQSVCKTWALAAYMVIAKRKSSLDTAEQLCFDYPRFSRFANKFQDGRYLSQGVCKDVYCVVNPSTSNLEAVSVMDVDDLLERGMDVAITQELQISLLCSSLVNLKICPNLVQVYSLFQAGFNAPVRLWDGKKSIGDLRNLALSGGSVGGGVVRSSSRQGAGLRKCDLSAGRYQYIRMEFCSGGDVEERIRAIDQADIRAVQAMFFQMCFSMYAGREKLSLRHFDIKLLNFFVTTKDILHQNQQDAQLKQTQNHHTTSTTNLLVGMGQHVYGIPLQPGELSLIKLADFGTSAVGAKGLGDPITIQQVRQCVFLIDNRSIIVAHYF